MHQIKAAIAGTLALFVASAAIAQTFPTVASQTVIGRLGVPGSTGPSQAIPFATLSAQLFSLVPSQLYDVSHYGVLPGNTATANTAAIGAVEALTGAPRPMYVPPGRYNTNFNPFQVTNQVYNGPGQFVMGGYAQAPQRAFVLSPQPAVDPDRYKSFDSGLPYAFEKRYSFVGSGAAVPYQITGNLVNGSVTIGSPTWTQLPVVGQRLYGTGIPANATVATVSTSPNVLTLSIAATSTIGGATINIGVYRPLAELSQTFSIYDYGAGFNLQPDNQGGGRSGAYQDYHGIYHGGQGDLTSQFYYGEVYSGCGSGTHFLSCPAVGIMGGGVGASSAASHSYLQISEFILNDAGLPVAAIGDVRNFMRSQGPTSFGEVWVSQRAQATGAVSSDAGYQIAGSWKVGLDTTPSSGVVASVAQKAGDRIYLAASSTPNANGFYGYADTLGTSWISSVSDNTGFFVKGFNSLNVQSALGTPVNNITVTGQITGTAPQIIANGPDTNLGLQLAMKGTGQAFFTNSAGFMFVPSGNDTLLAGALAQTVTNKVIDGASNTISNVPAGSLSGTTLKSTVVNSSLSNFTSYVKPAVVTVATLPACSGVEGARMGVSDANATTFLSVVAGGGSNHVPVYCNGTNWVIGG